MVYWSKILILWNLSEGYVGILWNLFWLLYVCNYVKIKTNKQKILKHQTLQPYVLLSLVHSQILFVCCFWKFSLALLSLWWLVCKVQHVSHFRRSIPTTLDHWILIGSTHVLRDYLPHLAYRGTYVLAPWVHQVQLAWWKPVMDDLGILGSFLNTLWPRTGEKKWLEARQERYFIVPARGTG